MKRRTITLLLMIMIFSIKSSCQKFENGKESFFSQYNLLSNDLTSVIDSFLIQESKYSYFSTHDTNTIFQISVLDSFGNILQLSSGKNGYFLLNKSQTDIFGILKYKGFPFIINGRVIPNSSLLYKTKKEIGIPIVDYNNQFERIEDDRYFPSIWICKYESKILSVVYKSKLEIPE